MIGGQVVKNAPNHVGAVLLEKEGEFKQSCTSTLIDDDSILLAGHCFGVYEVDQIEMQARVDAGEVFVCLGESN